MRTPCGAGTIDRVSTDVESAPKLGDRSLFSTLTARAYLNHSGISAPADPVRAAIHAAADDLAARGAQAFMDWEQRREKLREQLACLVGGDAADIGFVPNTSTGLNHVAWSIPWQTGDRVVVVRDEYPSNVTPWQRVSERFGLQLEFIDVAPFAQPGGVDTTQLDAALARGPRLVAFSAVQFQTGLRMPLEAIGRRCRERGVLTCVDAVQACGAVDLVGAAQHVDFLVSGAHKWLMAVDGAGFMHARPEAMRALHPAYTGAMSYVGATDMLFEGPGHLRYDRSLREGPAVFETGMVGIVAFAALGASVDLLLRLGIDAIFEHIQGYHDALEQPLMDRGFRSLRATDRARRSGILSFDPPTGMSAHELAPALCERGIVCSGPDGKLRLAPHWPNALTEVPVILDALDAELPGAGPSRG